MSTASPKIFDVRSHQGHAPESHVPRLAPGPIRDEPTPTMRGFVLSRILLGQIEIAQSYALTLDDPDLAYLLDRISRTDDQRARAFMLQGRRDHRSIEAEAALFGENDQPPTLTMGPSRFNRIIVNREFLEAPNTTKFLVENLIASDHPCVIGGPEKTCKTLSTTDLSVSLATRTLYLGEFQVLEPVRVHYSTLESGLDTMRNYARRIMDFKGLGRDDLGDRLILNTVAPSIAEPSVLSEYIAELRDLRPEVAILDPLYLCGLEDVDSTSIFEAGRVYRTFFDRCLELAITPVVVHHAKKQIVGDISLKDLLFSGLSQSVGQWLLFQPQEDYDEETGTSRLLLKAGGRADQSERRYVTIVEGKLGSLEGRFYQVDCRKPNASSAEAPQAIVQKATEKGTNVALAKQAEELAIIETNATKMLEAFERERRKQIKNGESKEGVTKTQLGNWCGVTRSTSRQNAIDRLVETGKIAKVPGVSKIGKTNTKPLDLYKLPGEIGALFS